MSKREEGICIWIHHIATGLGVIMGMAGLSQDPGGHLSQM